MKQRIPFFVVLALFAGISVAQTRPQAGVNIVSVPSFKIADRNRDGVVSKVEAIQAKLLLKYDTFEELDRDGDGRLSKFEYDLASTQMPSGHRHGG